MNLLGEVNGRKVYYIQIRNNPEWENSLPKNNWIVFTIANKEDEALVPSTVKFCIERNVSYTCSAGTLAHWTEQCFDEEIVEQALDFELQTKEKFDYNFSPITTAHKNFSEEFWFATTLAYHEYKELDKVICLDFTERKVKKSLASLVKRINNGWLPSNEKIELAKYDD